MKNIEIKFSNLLFNLAVSLLVLTIGFGVSPYVAAGVAVCAGTILGFFPEVKFLGFNMAIQKEIWQTHLIGNYWADNAFAKKAVQCPDEHIYGGKIVHIPAVNGRPGVVRNRTEFPATIGTRQDNDILYAIDEFFVDPWRIPNAENYELSYPKRQSVVQEQSSAANQAAANWLLRHWFKYSQVNNDGTTTTTTAQILRTTGGETAKTAAAHIGSGSRKLVTVADLKAAKVKFNNADVPTTDRYAILDSEMLDQLTQDPEYKKAEKVYEQELINGSTAKIQGFNIFERSKVLTMDAAGTALEPYGAVPAAGANGGALLWHSHGVETAIGTVEFFDNPKVAEFYGDIVSAILRASGRIRRADSVIALVQGA